jgi:hypothetical protein
MHTITQAHKLRATYRLGMQRHYAKQASYDIKSRTPCVVSLLAAVNIINLTNSIYDLIAAFAAGSAKVQDCIKTRT